LGQTAFPIDLARESEIEHSRLIVLVDHDVLRLQVPVQRSALVREVNRFGDGTQIPRCRIPV